MSYLILTDLGIEMENELHLIWCQRVNENWFQMEGELQFYVVLWNAAIL